MTLTEFKQSIAKKIFEDVKVLFPNGHIVQNDNGNAGGYYVSVGGEGNPQDEAFNISFRERDDNAVDIRIRVRGEIIDESIIDLQTITYKKLRNNISEIHDQEFPASILDGMQLFRHRSRKEIYSILELAYFLRRSPQQVKQDVAALQVAQPNLFRVDLNDITWLV